MTKRCNGRSNLLFLRKFEGLLLLILLFIPVSIYAKPLDLNTSLETRFSDNIAKTKDKKSDVEYTAKVNLEKEDRVGKFDYIADAEFRYLFYQQEVFDNELEADIVLDGDYHLIPNQFVWNVKNDLNEVTIDTASADTPDNRERKNIFSTGPRYTLPINQRNNLSFLAQYQRTDFQTSGLDSDRYEVRSSFNHLRNQYITLSAFNDWSKVRFSGSDDLYRVENAVSFNSNYEHYIGRGSIGNTSIKTRRPNEVTQTTDLFTWDLGIQRDINSNSELELSYSRELNDTSSDITVRNDNSSINYTEEGIVQVTEWSLRYQKRFSNSSSGDLKLYHNESDYKSSESDEENVGAKLRYKYPITSLVVGTLDFDYEHSVFSELSQKDDTYTTEIGVVYNVARNVNLSAETGYEDRESNLQDKEYNEWWVSFTISYRPNLY